MYAGREYDASWREPMWERVCNDLGGDDRAKEIVASLKTMYTMYTDDLIDWYANLYDPFYGAWYCTTSGKENEGFLPDIESTSQALNFIEQCGLIDHLGNDWTKVLPNEMKEKLLKFAKRMQEPNGFFYNFLKTVEQGDASLGKRGRDVGWCTSIIKRLGGTPTYDTPNGIKGDGIDYNSNPVFKTVSANNTKEDTPAASKSYPEYLESKETFLKYLNEEVDIVNKSYFYGNQLNGTYGQIKARDAALRSMGCDYSLCDTLIEWLNERIDPNTGYWSPKPTFAGTNGYFKVIVIYNSWGYPYPTLEKAADSVIQGILGDEPSTGNICEVYNLWSALISTKENAKKCHSAETRDIILAKIKDLMLDKGKAAILNTYKKQSAYQMPDGAFAHNVVKCITAHQGGIPVGLGLEEGDVDAIGKATIGIVNNIFTAYEIKKVPIYSKREWDRYFEIMLNSKPVIKTQTKTYR